MAGERQALDPVQGDEVPKIDNAIAVGEDLGFQERWWTFERVTWSLFALILIADVLGAFGNGWLAKATMQPPGSGMLVHYERVERAGTPSTMSVQFGPEAVRNGKVQMFASGSIVKGLGAQRVIPEPEISAITQGGMQYTFAAGDRPGEVAFELEPSAPGIHWFDLQVAGLSPVRARVVVMP